jgi:hypothetical protein
MSTSDTAMMGGGSPPSVRHKRRLRNYLLDAGLQLRYTGFIIMVAVFLTGALGWKIFRATQDTSKVIWMTGLVDPASAGELQAQFRTNDRIVMAGIVGFGVLLVVSIAGAGIWITHKVAGPLYSIGAICRRVRDNQLAPSLRQLRRGDELQEFYSSFREMYEAIRGRVDQDLATMKGAIAALETVEPRTAAVTEALDSLRRLRKEKEDSLSG